MCRNTILAAFAAALALWAGTVGAAPPATFTYGGFLLTDAGAPVTTATDLTFRFYDAAIGGSQIGTADLVTVTPSAEGYFTAVVGTGIAGFPALFEIPVWMTVQVEGDAEMTPRIPITSVPSALAVPWSGVTSVPAPCPAGRYLQGYDAVGNAVCAGDANSGGTVTSITAGSGLSGGTITGSGTIAISSAGCTNGQVLKWSGSAWACAADAGGTTYSAGSGLTLTGTTFSVASAGCAAGQVLKWGGSTWGCQADANSGGTVTSVTAASGGGLAVTGVAAAPAVGLLTTCTASQVLKWNGSGWACAADAGGTAYSAGSGLTLTGTTFSLNTAAANTWTAGQTFNGQISIGWEQVNTTAPINSVQPSCLDFVSAPCYYGAAAATCSTGKRLLGGGCWVYAPYVSSSVALSAPSGYATWQCYATTAQLTNPAYTVTAYAICARVQ
jgi:hypothetical protein